MTFKEFVDGSNDFPKLKSVLVTAVVTEGYEPTFKGDWGYAIVDCPADEDSGHHILAAKLEAFIDIKSAGLMSDKPLKMEVLKGWAPKYTKGPTPAGEFRKLDFVFAVAEVK